VTGRPPGRLANRLLLPLLRHPAGRGLGRRLAVVQYDGRRTGQRRQLVTAYTRTGSRVVIDVGWPERKTWWRNFQTPHPVRVRLAGEDHDTTAHVERDGEAVRVVIDLDRGRDRQQSDRAGGPASG
jgi:hypothetical protein